LIWVRVVWQTFMITPPGVRGPVHRSKGDYQDFWRYSLAAHKQFGPSGPVATPTLSHALGRWSAQTRRHLPCSNSDLGLCSGKVERAGSVAVLASGPQLPWEGASRRCPVFRRRGCHPPWSNTDLEFRFGKVECAGSVATLTSGTALGKGPAQMPCYQTPVVPSAL